MKLEFVNQIELKFSCCCNGSSASHYYNNNRAYITIDMQEFFGRKITSNIKELVQFPYTKEEYNMYKETDNSVFDRYRCAVCNSISYRIITNPSYI